MSIKEWIVKKVLVRWVKRGLDKLPFNNKKTLLGVVITILSALASSLTGSTSVIYVLHFALEVLTQLDYTQLTPGTTAVIVGYVTTIVGAFHKVLKRLDR